MNEWTSWSPRWFPTGSCYCFSWNKTQKIHGAPPNDSRAQEPRVKDVQRTKFLFLFVLASPRETLLKTCKFNLFPRKKNGKQLNFVECLSTFWNTFHRHFGQLVKFPRVRSAEVSGHLSLFTSRAPKGKEFLCFKRCKFVFTSPDALLFLLLPSMVKFVHLGDGQLILCLLVQVSPKKKNGKQKVRPWISGWIEWILFEKSSCSQRAWIFHGFLMKSNDERVCWLLNFGVKRKHSIN